MDRDLNWRPYVVIHQTSWGPDSLHATDKVWLRNIGRGPAFNAVCARLYYIKSEPSGVLMPHWRLAIETPQTIEADGIKEFSLQDPPSNAPATLGNFEINQPPQPTLSIFYQDIVGKRVYRLCIPRAAPDIWSLGDNVDVWVSWYLAHIGLQVPAK